MTWCVDKSIVLALHLLCIKKKKHIPSQTFIPVCYQFTRDCIPMHNRWGEKLKKKQSFKMKTLQISLKHAIIKNKLTNNTKRMSTPQFSGTI